MKKRQRPARETRKSRAPEDRRPRVEFEPWAFRHDAVDRRRDKKSRGEKTGPEYWLG